VPKKLVAYTGLCPRVHQSSGKDHRGSPSKNGPKYLRWVLIEAAIHAAYAEHYERTAKRLGRQRGNKVARVEVARKLAEAIFYVLKKGEPFAPYVASPRRRLTRPDRSVRQAPRVCSGPTRTLN